MSSPDSERAQRELEELLRRVPLERLDPARLARARQTFLATAAAGGQPSQADLPARMGAVMGTEAHGRGDAGQDGAGQDGDGQDGRDDQSGFEAWLAARAPAVLPSAEGHRRARLAFLSAVAATPPPLRARRSFRRLVWAAAAAAILAVTFFLPQPERWSVQLDGRLSCDATEYLPGDEARLAAALERSGTVATALARARFALGGELVLELLTDTELEFPFQTELDGVAPLEFALTRGETYLRTRAGYPGNPVVVRTELANVALHGTTVGVLVDELGTCVCVADGTARVTSALLPTGYQDVGPRGTLRVFFDPGMGPKFEAFPADGGGPESAHTADLVAFQREP